MIIYWILDQVQNDNPRSIWILSQVRNDRRVGGTDSIKNALYSKHLLAIEGIGLVNYSTSIRC